MKVSTIGSGLVLTGFAIASGISSMSGMAAQDVKQSWPNPSSLVAVNQTARESLAKHLKQVGAKMYGAYWCPYCTQQKELFGQAVFDRYITYIECDARGKNPKPNLCKAAKVRGFPTWDIRGKQYIGRQSLESLATASNYKGSRNF
jgi:glutaredoxin